MRAKHVIPLALVLAVGMGGAVIAQGQQPSGQPAAKPLTRQQVQVLERQGSVAANLEGAYEAAIAAHAAEIQGQDQIALNQVLNARAQLQNVQRLRITDPDLERALNELVTLSTLAQRRLSARSQASEQALQALVLRFNQAMVALPQMGGGGGGALDPMLSQKLAFELVSESYRSLANAQASLVRGNQRAAELWLEEAQLQLQSASTAPGGDRLKDLLGAVQPALELARRQTAENSPQAVSATAQAIEQMATRIANAK